MSSLRDKLMALRYAKDKMSQWYHFEQTRQEWRRRNAHNYTEAGLGEERTSFPMEQVHVGNWSYGRLNVGVFTGKEEGLFIGHFCSIANSVQFLLGGEHPHNHASTFPFKFFNEGQFEATSKGAIVLEDDVWIGERAVILSGVTLRRGTVVAAGSVVTKSTEPYSIVGGAPAKHIKYRFPQAVIDKLMQIDYSRLTADKIKANMALLYTDVTEENVTAIVENLTN